MLFLLYGYCSFLEDPLVFECKIYVRAADARGYQCGGTLTGGGAEGAAFASPLASGAGMASGKTPAGARPRALGLLLTPGYVSFTDQLDEM